MWESGEVVEKTACRFETRPRSPRDWGIMEEDAYFVGVPVLHVGSADRVGLEIDEGELSVQRQA